MVNQVSTEINSTVWNYKSSVSADTGKQKASSDTVSISAESVVCASYTVEGRLTESEGGKYDYLKDYVAELLEKQGLSVKDALEGKEYIIDEATSREAAELTSEGGYWGVEQTAERIFQFAVNVSGNDEAMLEEIKEAIEKGFNMALDAFGGELPEISWQTYDTVMEKLDSWAGVPETQDMTETE